jgi:hypothetical protein
MITPKLSDNDLLTWYDHEIDIVTRESSNIVLSEGQINITLKRLKDKRSELYHKLHK